MERLASVERDKALIRSGLRSQCHLASKVAILYSSFPSVSKNLLSNASVRLRLNPFTRWSEVRVFNESRINFMIGITWLIHAFEDESNKVASLNILRIEHIFASKLHSCR